MYTKKSWCLTTSYAVYIYIIFLYIYLCMFAYGYWQNLPRTFFCWIYMKFYVAEDASFPAPECFEIYTPKQKWLAQLVQTPAVCFYGDCSHKLLLFNIQTEACRKRHAALGPFTVSLTFAWYNLGVNIMGCPFLGRWVIVSNVFNVWIIFVDK